MDRLTKIVMSHICLFFSFLFFSFLPSLSLFVSLINLNMTHFPKEKFQQSKKYPLNGFHNVNIISTSLDTLKVPYPTSLFSFLIFKLIFFFSLFSLFGYLIYRWV